MLLPGTADTSIQTEARMCAKSGLRPTAGWQAGLALGVPWEGRQLSHVIAGVSNCDSKGEPVLWLKENKTLSCEAPLLLCHVALHVSVFSSSADVC